MGWKSYLSVVMLAVSAFGCAVGEREPSEREMRQAVEAKFEQVNANLRAMAESCRRREFRDNPLLAMQCLTICGAAGGESCDVSFKLTRFEKMGCGEPGEQAGYVCDYVIGVSSSSPLVRGALEAITGPGGAGQGRFVRSENGNGWAFLPVN